MKISNLPKTGVSSKQDLLTVVQGGVTKTISKKDLLNSLESKVSSVVAEIKALKNNVAKKTISKDTPSFSKPITSPHPISNKHLTTKEYVDNQVFNTLKNDGSTKIAKNLSYKTHPTRFANTDVVDKQFVDEQLEGTLKTLQKLKGNAGYPNALAGECFILEESYDVFAVDGPEVQKGDLLICIEDSEGGAHSAIGLQFAIVNTNVVFATEQVSGTLKVATLEELEELESETSALTPFKYKQAIESGSEYNRIEIRVPRVELEEMHKGIIGVDCRRNAVALILPTIKKLKNPKITKFIIKDEYGSSVKNNITVSASGGDTIQGSKSQVVSSNLGSIKCYNDGAGKWFIESSSSGADKDSYGVKTFVTDTPSTGERPTVTGEYESVMTLNVDLKEYPVGTGFKLIAHCKAAANSNTKTVAIGISGTQVLASSNTTTTAPNDVSIHHELTVLNTGAPNAVAFGFVIVGVDLDAVATDVNSALALDWGSSINVSLDVNVATAATNMNVYAFQLIPLK